MVHVLSATAADFFAEVKLAILSELPILKVSVKIESLIIFVLLGVSAI
jgi:hypothetical protein